jgi:hypothetical protein
VGKDTALCKKRSELKQEITCGMQILLMGLIFDYTGRLIQKLTRRSSSPPFYYLVIVVALIIHLPGLLSAMVLNENRQFARLWMGGFLSLELAIAGLVVAKININYVLQNLRDHVVDAIEPLDHLSDLQQWLPNFWAIRKQVIFFVTCGLVLGTWSMFSWSQMMGEFVGWSFAVSAFLMWAILGVPAYYIFLMVLLPLRLSRYRYNLFEANPNHSDVVRHLSLTLKNYTYVIAGFFAFATFFFGVASPIPSLRSWNFSIIILVTGWIPLTAQFISNRAALKQIVRTAKWRTLKAIECRIKTIQDRADLADKETMECITRLMDYHDRISATHDTALEFRARLSFVTQILLTVLAYILSNIDRILAIFQ